MEFPKKAYFHQEMGRDGPTLRQSVALATVDFLFLIDI
jgi:hypothetical protein